MDNDSRFDGFKEEKRSLAAKAAYRRALRLAND